MLGLLGRLVSATCSADCDDWSERSLPLRSFGGFQHHSTPLCTQLMRCQQQQPHCDYLGCVHPHYEGLYRGLLPRRGLSVRLAPLACHRSSCLSRLVSFSGLVIITRYFSSRVSMTFSLCLVIVTCFAMSFALRADATSRLILDASLLHCTRAAVPTLLNRADQSFCWMQNSVFSFLLVAELSLSAECGRLC